jgi:PAS domain S-box-containing protein
VRKWRIVWVGLGLGAFYWISNSFTDSFIFHEGTFAARLFSPGPVEIFIRMLTISAIVAFGIFMQFSVNKREKIEGELKKAISRAEDERARSEAIIAAIGDAVTIQDTDFKIIYQNEVAKNVIGNHIGEYCFTAYERKESVCDGCPVAMAFKDGKIHTVVRSVLTDKGLKYLENTASALSDSRGKLIAGIEVVRDITERKRMEKKLVETSQTLQSLIHASPLAITVLDPNGIVTMWNPAAERIFGWSEQEVVGRFYPVVPDERKDEFRVFHARVLQGESFTGVEVVRRRKDGLSVDIDLSTAPLRDFKGDVVGAMGIMADITERKRMEEQIKRSLMEKEILLKEIHHRVKNNLQIISSMLNLQSEYVKDKYALDLFTESRNRVKSMALIHEKLYQSKDLARINFLDYVRTLTKDLFRSYRRSSAEIALKMDIEDVFLDIDKAVSCGLIINELITNSLKHAFPSGSEGEITIGLHPDINGMFALTVSDNGTGLPENIDSRNVESLGLQLVALLVEQLDGAIELDKRKGTSFRITFKGTTTTGKG